MKELVNYIINSKKGIIIISIVCIILIISITTIVTYHFINKTTNDITSSEVYKEEILDDELDKDTITNNNPIYKNEDESENIETILPVDTLFHIVSTKDSIIYDILIDNNSKITIAFQEQSKDNSYIPIINKEHIIVDAFNVSQKEYLINYLNSLEYSYDLEENIETGFAKNIIIDNYQINKEFINIKENYLLEILINSIIENNPIYFNYLEKDNNVENYIKDSTYTKLDVNSESVKNLYNIVVPNFYAEETYNLEVFDSYKKNKLDNDTKISLTLYKLLYKDEANSNCIENNIFKTCYIDNNLFDKTFRNLFGNIKYDLSTYDGYDTTNSAGFNYDSIKKQLTITYYSGDEFDDCLYSEIAFAYETDNKIVIIEKTLYYIIYDSNNSYQQTPEEVGLYNNTDKEIKLITNMPSNGKKLLDDLNPFVTYYAHTFTKENGNYYYTDIARLN